MIITKKGLISRIASASGVTIKQTNRVISALIAEIAIDLEENQEALLPHLGKLEVVTRKERLGRNPKNGDKVFVPAHKAVRFKPLKALKAVINRQNEEQPNVA